MRPARPFVAAVLPVALAVVLSALLAAPAAAEGPSGVAPVLEAFQAAEYRKAVELAAAVPEDSEDAPRARYLAGEAHLALGDAAAAEEEFRAVLAKRPAALPAKVGLGRALTSLGKGEEAEKVLDDARKQDGKDVSVQRALGEMWTARDEVDKAVKVLEAAYKADPTDASTVRALAEARLRGDDLKQVVRLGEKLAKALPKHPMGPFVKALALEKDRKDDEAIVAYEEAIARDDRFLDAHKNLAILCHTRNPTYQDRPRTEKAMKHYARYFELGGSDERLRKMYDTLRAFFEQQPPK
jgi:tetratricopeptide (TPR) repeat protein